MLLMGVCCREAGRHWRAEALLEDLSGSCASQAHFSEAAAHMLQLAQDAFAAVILLPNSGCLWEMPPITSPLSLQLSPTSSSAQALAMSRGHSCQQMLRVAFVPGSELLTPTKR